MLRFKFTANPGFDFIREFAHCFDISAEKNYLAIPETLGSGFIRRIVFTNSFSLLVHRYQLNDSFTLKRDSPEKSNDFITLRFRDYQSVHQRRVSNIQMLTHNISLEDSIAANTLVLNVIINIHKDSLLRLFEEDISLQDLNLYLTKNNDAFLYQEHMTIDIKNVMRSLVQNAANPQFSMSYDKIKTLELIYLYFARLLVQKRSSFAGLSKKDAETMLFLEHELLQNLHSLPRLSVLARSAGMSETKLKQLFKAVFGNSIYQYYQEARIREAATLLQKTPGITISEVAYSLGFTNLSHFSRLFRSYTGQNPKSYAMEHHR